MSKSSQHLDHLSTAELANQARRLQSSRSYKELIQVYKLLAKREPGTDWRSPLADAYLERAKQLAAKSLYKEALMLWDNMAALSASPQAPELAINWLLRAGQPGKAIALFTQISEDQPAYRRLEPLMAALLLAQPKLIPSLSATSSLQQALQTAQHALSTYCNGATAEQVRETLQAIRFRSPLRDLRHLLNALLKLEEGDRAEAIQILDRVAADSPFASLVSAVQVSCLPASELAGALKSLPPAQYGFATHWQGLSKPQLKLLKQYQGLTERANDKAQFNFIVNNLSMLDKAAAQKACLALLSTYPQARKNYEKLFGPVPALELARMAALRAEQQRDLSATEKQWHEVFVLLAQEADQGNSDAALQAALVLRHVISILLEARPDFREDPPPLLLKKLELSLRFDPDDKATYLRLAELYRVAGNAKRYQHWVAQAIQLFPNDSEVLLAAADAASRRKAFKKAASYANQLLALDPINQQAKTVLIEAHLAHARKSVLAGKPHLAHKELAHATTLQGGSIVTFNQGLLALLEEQATVAERYMQQGLEQAENSVVGVLQLWVEADRLGLALQPFRHYAAATDVLEPAQLLTVIRQINRYLDEELPLRQFLDELLKPLRQSAERITDEKTMRVICDCWNRVPHYDLLAAYGAAAQRRWPDTPVFLYYQIFGATEGNIDLVSNRDYERLEEAAEQAGQAKDVRTMMRIHEFLDGPAGGPGMPPEVEEMLDELEHLPPKERQAMLRNLVETLSDELGPPPPEIEKMLYDDIDPAGPAGNIDYGSPFPFDLPPFDHAPPRRNKRKKKPKRKRK